MKDYTQAIRDWNEFIVGKSVGHGLEIYPHPASHQAILKAAADEATAYFDSLTAEKVNGRTILTATNGRKYEYVYQDGLESYIEVIV